MPVSIKIRPIDSRDADEMAGGECSCFGEGCTALVTHAVSGEEDSFGTEWHLGCLTHCKESQEKGNQPFCGCCDWCRTEKDNLRPHRDFEEGTRGPVYDVCEECRLEESKRVEDELKASGHYDDDMSEDFEYYEMSELADYPNDDIDIDIVE